MKMDNCLLTLVFGLSMLGSLDGCDIYAAEGQNVTVRLKYNLQELDALKWRFNENAIFHRKRKTIVIEAPAGMEVNENGSLKLTNLKKNNAGTYTPDVHTYVGKSAKEFDPINLCILDSFPDPVVMIECSKTTPTMVTFTCNVGKAQDLTFQWLKNKKEMKEKTQILRQKAEDVEEDSFECIVSNPALSKTSKAVQHMCTSPNSVPDPEVTIDCSKTIPTMVTFTCNVSKAQGLTFQWLKNKKEMTETKEMKEKPQILKQKAEDVEKDSFECIVSNLALSKTSKAVQHECTSSSKLFGLDFWIMVGILGGGGGLVLLLIIIVIVCCVRARKKRSMDEGNSCLLTYSTDEEELRLGWTNSEQQHHHHKHNHLPGYHHHHHHHHQQQPVGHTGPRTASSSSSDQIESPQNAKSVTPCEC